MPGRQLYNKAMQMWLTDGAVWNEMYFHPRKIPDYKGIHNVYAKSQFCKYLLFLVSQRNSLGKKRLEKLDFLIWNCLYQLKCGKLLRQLMTATFFSMCPGMSGNYFTLLVNPFLIFRRRTVPTLLTGIT